MGGKDKDPKFVRNYQFWVMVKECKGENDGGQFVLGRVDTYRKYRYVIIQDMLTKEDVTIKYDDLLKYGKRITRFTANDLYEVYCSKTSCAGDPSIFIEEVKRAPVVIYQPKEIKKDKKCEKCDECREELTVARIERLRKDIDQRFLNLERLVNKTLAGVNAEIYGAASLLKVYISDHLTLLAANKLSQMKLDLHTVSVEETTCKNQQTKNDEKSDTKK